LNSLFFKVWLEKWNAKKMLPFLNYTSSGQIYMTEISRLFHQFEVFLEQVETDENV